MPDAPWRWPAPGLCALRLYDFGGAAASSICPHPCRTDGDLHRGDAAGALRDTHSHPRLHGGAVCAGSAWGLVQSPLSITANAGGTYTVTLTPLTTLTPGHLTGTVTLKLAMTPPVRRAPRARP